MAKLTEKRKQNIYSGLFRNFYPDMNGTAKFFENLFVTDQFTNRG